MTGTSPEQRAQHLARIRDNQRRSRARRKEYLQELETKYRECEQSGVQASAEVQQAAKKVLEENKRLRALLRQQGYTDTQIDTMPLDIGDLPSTAGPGMILESVLSQRKRCPSSSPPQASSYQPATPSSATSSTPSLHGQYSRYGTPANPQQFPSPVSTASVPQSSATMTCNIVKAEHPSALLADYRMTPDDVAWFQEQYRRVQVQHQPYPATTNMNHVPSCYPLADNSRTLNSQLGAEFDDDLAQFSDTNIMYR